MENFGVVSVGAIVIICFLIGMAVKASNINSKWIPVIVGIAGGFIAVVAHFVEPSLLPTGGLVTDVAIGVASGFAAVGVHQVGKQLNQGE